MISRLFRFIVYVPAQQRHGSKLTLMSLSLKSKTSSEERDAIGGDNFPERPLFARLSSVTTSFVQLTPNQGILQGLPY